ncbi:MFS transporter [Cupriavidus numazuensis]|uniref:4-hydroxybenzoate transporter PcaK n=1 Tax=Cupriavidus numazuensis TaxID=221992 RepID=A0ABM8TGJ2_9BURK|nr:MFS transporter [Cupriavidus numazuensis]CAG2145008.1 4-hydroxybenzoate transporter PcaK [Cupriavidus numazuensis]
MRQIDLRAFTDDARLGRFHAVLLFWCAFVTIVDGYDLALTGVALPSIMKDMGVSPTSAGFMVSSAFFGMMFGAISLGTLADRIGRRKAFALCILLFSGFTAAAGLASDPLTFSAMRFLAGVGIGGVTPVVAAHVTEFSPRRLRTTLVTLMFTGFSIGGMVAALTGKGLLERHGWQSVYFAACLPLLSIPFILRWLPESMPFLLRRGDTGAIRDMVMRIQPGLDLRPDDKFVVGTAETGSGAHLSKLFSEGRSYSTLMFWVSSFMCLFMVYGLSSWLTKLMASAGHSLGSALTFVLVLNLGALIGAILGGWLADRWHIKHVLMGMYLVAGASIVLLGYLPSSALAYVLVAIAGGSTIGTQIVGYAYAGQFYPMSVRSTGIGWASGVGRGGAILAPIVIGTLVSMALPLEHNFIAMAIPAVIATIAVATINHRRAASVLHA